MREDLFYFLFISFLFIIGRTLNVGLLFEKVLLIINVLSKFIDRNRLKSIDFLESSFSNVSAKLKQCV